MLRRLARGWICPVVLGRGVRVALVLFFVWLVAPHWDPYYGFTRFLQCDAHAASTIVPALAGTPLFVHPDPGSYDGFFYAEIATDPSLRTPALVPAVDDLGYRGRRILLSAVAWLAGRGDPVVAVHAFAWLNVIAWFALAALLWRLFPSDDWRGTLAWTGMMFAAGTLLNVRLALPDLAALFLTAGAVRLAERGRRGAAAGWLAGAALARETALLGIVALLPSRGATKRARYVALAWSAAAIVPLALWIGHVRRVVGSSGTGLRNFAWPLMGWLGKASDVLTAIRVETNHLLVATTLLCLLALAVQWLYILARPMFDDGWWRTGAAYAGLMVVLGPSVWGDDLPGAAVRVLLPLALAFNVLAVRRRAGLAWLVLGNASVFGGMLALWNVSQDPHEFATGRLGVGDYAVHTDAGWQGVEHRGKHRWAWCAQRGEIAIETWPRKSRPLRVSFAVQGFTPRAIEIAANGRTLWSGRVDHAETVSLVLPLDEAGRTAFEIESPAAPQAENTRPHARLLGFSISDLQVE